MQWAFCVMATKVKKEEGLNDRQKLFASRYLIHFNATRAAEESGYSKKTAAVIGYENLRKPYIRQFINEKLAERCLNADETTKLINDIATGNLADYFVVKKVPHTPLVETPLRTVIQKLKSQIDFEKRYFAKLTDADDTEKAAFIDKIKAMERDVIRKEMEYQHNPKKICIVEGETVMVETVEIDMVAIKNDKERGRVKSISHNQYGIKVEMYGADAAAINLAKMHGLFEKDNAQSRAIAQPYSDNQVDKLIKVLREGKTKAT